MNTRKRFIGRAAHLDGQTKQPNGRVEYCVMAVQPDNPVPGLQLVGPMLCDSVERLVELLKAHEEYSGFYGHGEFIFDPPDDKYVWHERINPLMLEALTLEELYLFQRLTGGR